jgi:PhoPQ-activated pathogenicity-related protein
MAAPVFGPLFPAAEVTDRPSLDLKISQPVDYNPSSAPNHHLKRIDLTYTSFEWAGDKWRHPAIVLLPETVRPEYKGAAVVIAGNGSNPSGVPVQYAEAAALMGIPAMAIAGANPGPHYGAKNEGAVMAQMQKKFMETGDPHWIGYSALARVIVRGVTAMQAVPGVQADRFVITGGSKRGVASWIAAAADDRIAGAFPGAWNLANFEAVLKLQVERYGPESQAGGDGPGSESPAQRLASLKTARGREYQQYLDPWMWRDRIANKQILFSVGANDPLFPPLSDSVFLPGMPKSTRILLIPNKGHGHDSERETIAWRMWLAHVFANRPVPEIEVTWKRDGAQIVLSATVTGGSRIRKVRAWSASQERGAYLESRWSPTELTGKDGRDRGTLQAPDKMFTAFWIEAEDDDAASGPGVISTGMQEIKPS